MASRQTGGAAPEAAPEVRFVAHDPKTVELVGLLRKLAVASANVLLGGETGTGKDLAAHALHVWGGRSAAPLVKVDLPSVPAELMESELFGHEKGAFTGARARKPGKLELAGEGTVYLDQVGELDPALQAKLLRVVEDKRYERVGGTETLEVRARIVASTVTDLARAVEQGSFRPDLFHRLSVFYVRIPPLRERRGDIAPLARYFLDRQRARRGGGGPDALAPETLEMLESYDWPGNVRELKAAVERATLVAEGREIRPEHLPEHVAESPAVTFRLGRQRRPSLAEVEKIYIELTLRHVGGNQTRAAEILGISRKALWEKRRRYGIP